MKKCSEFDPSMVESIEAYPIDGILSEEIEALSYQNLGELQLSDFDVSLISNNKINLPMSDKPSYSDTSNTSRPGKLYDISIEVPYRDPDRKQVSDINSLEKSPHLFIIKCFYDNYFIVIPARETYSCERSMKDGVGTIKISCQNMSGIIPYVVKEYDVI